MENKWDAMAGERQALEEISDFYLAFNSSVFKSACLFLLYNKNNFFS